MGKIIFSTNNSLFARLIRKLTKSTVSHIAFEYNDNTVSHSTVFKGVANNSKSEFKHSQKVVYCYTVKDPDYKHAKIVFRQQKKKLFGFFDILYLSLSILLGRIIRFKNPIQDGLICSEYVSLYIDKCMGTKLNSSSYPPNPNDLLLWCKKNLDKTSY